MLACADDAGPGDILAWFVSRWQVEVTFEEVRAHLGVETQRQWSDKAILRTTPILLGLFSIVTIWAHDLSKSRRDLPDVPLFIDQAKNDADRQALDLLLERPRFARPYVAPSGVPRDRLELIRRPFDATMKDPDLMKSVQAARLAVDNPMTGEQLTQEIARLSATPAAAMGRLSKLFDDYQASK